MNQQNLDYLKETLKFTGFGDKLYPDLEKNIEQGFPDFVLKLETAYGRDILEAMLHFRKGEQTDIYYLNRWQGKLTNGAGVREHIFYFNRGHGITLKEGYNLLDGRSVYKELINKDGQKYKAWLQLDLTQPEASGTFKMAQYHQNYGFDLEDALQRYPIRELGEEGQKERLLVSLQRGNLQSVTFALSNGEHRGFIEAAPKYKSVQVYDGNLKMLTREQKEELIQNRPSVPATLPDLTIRQEVNADTEGEVRHEIKVARDKIPVTGHVSLLPRKRNPGKKGPSMS